MALALMMSLLPAAIARETAASARERSVENDAVPQPAAAVKTTYTDGDWSFTLDNGVAAVSGYNGTATSITLPAKATISGVSYTIRTVGAGAFADNFALQSVTIPAQYIKLGNRAFKNCTNLRSITIKGDLLDASGNSIRNDSNTIRARIIPSSTTPARTWMP